MTPQTCGTNLLYFRYDDSGNPLTYWDGSTFTWNMGRQLTGMVKDGWSTSYHYNADGLRVGKTVYSPEEYAYFCTTRYTWVDGRVTSQINKDFDLENAITATMYFRYDDSGKPVSLEYNGTEYYYVTNLQGDIIALLDGQGNCVVEYTYDAWGKVLSKTGSMATSLGSDNPLRYRGYYYDFETGFYYLQSRYYDPATGRFINADDVSYLGASGTALSYNLFAYCENDPLVYSDLTGFLRVKTWLVATSLDVMFALINHVMMAGYISFSATVYFLARTPITRKVAVNLIKKKVLPVFVRGFYNTALTCLRKVLRTFGGIGREFAKGWGTDKLLNIMNRWVDTRLIDFVTSILTWGGIIAMGFDMIDGRWDGYISV